MQKLYKFISIFLVLCLMTASGINTIPVVAEDTSERSETVRINNNEIDNSELNVRVVKQTGGEQTTIFTGKLKDYAGGAWIHMDFSDIQFAVIFTWDDIDNDIVYIIPDGTSTDIKADITKPDDEDISEILSNNTTAAVQSTGIKCDVNLMYDGAYSERIMHYGKQLKVPVKVTNISNADKSVVCYIAEYDSNGKLLNTSSSAGVAIKPQNAFSTEITKTFSSNTKSVKIFVWNSGTLQPITGAIMLDENESDYYADTAAQSQEYDIEHPITGKINTANDVDYIKFVPQTGGEYTFNCISATNAAATLYNANQSILKSASTSYKCSLTKNQTYYLKVMGNIGDYVLSVQYNVPSDADSFDVYKFDVDTNIYKKSIKETCSELYYSNENLSKQMYDEYEDILGDDAELHRLPDFLAEHPKELSNFDTLLNQYYSTRYSEFTAIKQRYIDLIDKYAELANTASSFADNEETIEDIAEIQDEPSRDEDLPDNELQAIIGKYVPQAKQRENIEIDEIRSDIGTQATATPSLTIVSKTTTSITYNATFPASGQWGNTIWIVDFNTNNGLTLEKNLYGGDEYRPSGQQTINGLSPGGIYIIYMTWSTDGHYWGGDNSICRFVQLPNNTAETYTAKSGGRVTAKIETADKALASSSDFDTWLSRMDKAYNAYKDLTGYTPYNSKKIVMESTRDNLNDYMGITDGYNYWWVVFGYYTWGSTVFKHARAFYQGHLRRLSQGDWGDTPMHELSHVFDNYKWNFDSETLAQLKLYYVIEQLNAKVYRPDRYDNSSNGWYTKSNYHDLLKHDRYKDSYDDSFGNGTYASEGFASILIDIQKVIGWNPFKKTFRYFSSLSNKQIPYDNGDKLTLFLTKLKDYSGVDVLNYISSKDKRIIESHFGVSLDYVEPVYPTVSGGSGGGGRSEINADKGKYTVFEFTPTESANYYIYTSPYAGSGVSNDTYIEVYTNANLTGTSLASNDDYDGGRFSKVSIAATANTTYYIKVRHYASGQLHAELNITKDAPVQPLTLSGYQDIITSSGEFALFSFTPDKSCAYSFDVQNYGGGTSAYDTYIKLYDNISMTKRLGNGAKKILANLKAGHTYYLQFSGFLMRYARGRITVSDGQTLQFTKKSDSSFIYVNSPEYLTRIDIVDDSCHTDSLNTNIGIQPYMKIFESEQITGKNTYYQTHTSWWGDEPETYEPTASFYIDVDFYNPTGNTIKLSVNNLAYGTEYSVLENYYNGNGAGVNISIPAYEHRLLFETLGAPLVLSYPGAASGNGWDWRRHRSPMILFDFQVNSGNIVVSSLAAYDNSNLYLRKGSKNILDSSGGITENGEIISDLSQRPNETDLYGKMKGIARNESAWIDSDIELVIDDNTELGTPIPLTLKDSYYTYGIANPKWSWKSAINPLNDAWDGVLTMLPSGLHNFKYHYMNTSRQWHFDFQHRDLRHCSINGSGTSVNDTVPADIIDNAKRDMAAGRKEHFADDEAPDKYAMSIGEWGATYHYTVTVQNTTNNDRTVNVKMWSAENMIFGLKKQGETTYSTQYYTQINNTPNNPTNTATVSIPANTTATFEFVTLLGGGIGGLNHSIVIE